MASIVSEFTSGVKYDYPPLGDLPVGAAVMARIDGVDTEVQIAGAAKVKGGLAWYKTLEHGSICETQIRGSVMITWDLFKREGALLEIRAMLKTKARSPAWEGWGDTITGYFDDYTAFYTALRGLELDFGEAQGIYVTINPVKLDLFARAPNRLVVAGAGMTTSDTDILAIHWLLIDCDPIRTAHVSANDAELGAAVQRLGEIREYLRSIGWPDPVTARSGNGAHDLYSLELPNTEDARDLRADVLNALQLMFGNKGSQPDAVGADVAEGEIGVEIDQRVFNAARITKAYGTTPRKGFAVQDRPHRRSVIEALPDQLEPVTRAQLEAVAAIWHDYETEQKAEAERKREAARGPRGGAQRTDLTWEDVIDRWREAHPIEDQLAKYAYVSNGGARWGRQGNPKNKCVLVDRIEQKAYSFSNNDQMGKYRRFNSFDLFVEYEHSGDRKAAAIAAKKELGLWSEAEADPPPLIWTNGHGPSTATEEATPAGRELVDMVIARIRAIGADESLADPLAKQRQITDELSTMIGQLERVYHSEVAAVLAEGIYKELPARAFIRNCVADAKQRAKDETKAKRAQKAKKDPPAADLGGGSNTDLGNARRLVAQHGADLRFVYAWDKWLVWDGARWLIDETGEIERRAKATVASIYKEAAKCSDDSERKAIARHALLSESKAAIANMIALARSELGIPIRHTALDANPWLLNVQNGTIDLRTGDLKPHDRADLITKLAPVDFDRDAVAPTWITFLDRIFAKDGDLIDFVQRAAGLSLTAITAEHKLFFAYGGGNNGKSTFFETMAAVMGDYWQKAPTEMIMTRQQAGIPNDVARLLGARMVICAEIEDGQRMAESKVKDLTGGDTLSARFMRAEWFDFKPTHKLWLYGNHKPIIVGTDNGIWRRINLIPFVVTIPPEEINTQLPAILRGEASGVLAWAVRGCLQWQAEGLNPPDAVKAATTEYRNESDTIGAFLLECTVTDKRARVQAGALYKAYLAWADQAGERTISQTRFGRSIVERGFIRTDGRIRVYEGLGLIGAEEDEDRHETRAF